jgi:hypothetical protein
VDPADIIVGANTVKVTVRREGANSIVAHFAQVVGIPSLQMDATATAKADTAGKIEDCGVVPLGVAEPATQPFQTGCSPTYVLKQGGGAGNTGNFGYLQLPACAGSPCTGPSNGTQYIMCLITNGYCCELSAGGTLNTAPGNRSGPFKKAVSDRFAADTDQRKGICYSQYVADGLGNNKRVVLVPIINGDPNGSSPVTITRFAAFFLQNDVPGTGNNSVLNGEFIDYVAAGSGGGATNGPVTFTLRLIR